MMQKAVDVGLVRSGCVGLGSMYDDAELIKLRILCSKFIHVHIQILHTTSITNIDQLHNTCRNPKNLFPS